MPPTKIASRAACLLILVLASCASDTSELRRSAERGDAQAQLELAKRYGEGNGVERNLPEAARWLRKAAEQGNGEAQLAYGLLHRDGAGVPQDYQEALRWIRKAADGGTGAAQYMLGLLYEEGTGAPRDLVRALMWFNLASTSLSDQDQGTAARKRDWLLAVLTPSEIEQAQRLAREWMSSKSSGK